MRGSYTRNIMRQASMSRIQPAGHSLGGQHPDLALNGSKNGGGWEDCDKPISNQEVFGPLEYDADEPEVCAICGGQKIVMGRLARNQICRCRDCGIDSMRPIKNGVVMVSEERYL